MELSTLTIFVKVVQTGSFTRAAELLGSQKAHVSRVISQLERELGVRLLERSTRALSLTEMGRELFERALGILESVDEAQRVVQKAMAEPRGVLKLTCGVEFGMMAVNAWIEEYLQRYPDVEVDADFSSKIVDIVHDGFDLAIRVGPLADSTLAARKLGELTYGIWAAPSYLKRYGEPQHPQDLLNHTLLSFRNNNSSTWQFHQNHQQENIAIKARFKANNVFAIRDAAVAGLGIAMLPTLVASPSESNGRLTALVTDWHLPTVPVHAVFASARYLTPKVRAFIDIAMQDSYLRSE